MTMVKLKSQAHPIKGFLPSSEVKRRHPIELRHGIEQLNYRFNKTYIGKILNRVLSRKTANQTRVLMELHFEQEVLVRDLYTNRLVTAIGGKLSKEGELGIQSLVIVYNSKRKSIDFNGLCSRGRIVIELIPYNRKYQPERVNIQLYCIFLINLFKEISEKYNIKHSVPPAFKAVSDKKPHIQLDSEYRE